MFCESAADLVRTVRENQAEEASIWKIHLGDKGATDLAEALKENILLRRLTIYEAGVGPKGATAIAESLTSNSTLQKLDYTENKAGVEGMTALRKAWEKTRWAAWGSVGVLDRGDPYRPIVPTRKEFTKKFREGMPDNMSQAQWARKELAANPKIIF